MDQVSDRERKDTARETIDHWDSTQAMVDTVDTDTPGLPATLLGSRIQKVSVLKEVGATGQDWTYHSRAPFLHMSVWALTALGENRRQEWGWGCRDGEQT